MSSAGSPSPRPLGEGWGEGGSWWDCAVACPTVRPSAEVKSGLGISVAGEWRAGSRSQLTSQARAEGVASFVASCDRSGPCVACPSGKSPWVWQARQPLSRKSRLPRSAEGDSVAAEGKGDRHHLPERPEGCFAQMVPVPFFLARLARRQEIRGDGPDFDRLQTPRVVQALAVEVVVHAEQLRHPRAGANRGGLGDPGFERGGVELAGDAAEARPDLRHGLRPWPHVRADPLARGADAAYLVAPEAAVLPHELVAGQEFGGGRIGKPPARLQVHQVVVALQAVALGEPPRPHRKVPIEIAEPAAALGTPLGLLGQVVRRMRREAKLGGAPLAVVADRAAELGRRMGALRAAKEVRPRMGTERQRRPAAGRRDAGAGLVRLPMARRAAVEAGDLAEVIIDRKIREAKSAGSPRRRRPAR